MNNIEIGCGDVDGHSVHQLGYAEIGYGIVLCAGLQPPAEIAYSPASSIIGVTFGGPEGRQTQDVCLYEGDQHSGMTLPSDNIPRYVAGARAAHEQGMRTPLSASTLDALLKRSN